MTANDEARAARNAKLNIASQDPTPIGAESPITDSAKALLASIPPPTDDFNRVTAAVQALIATAVVRNGVTGANAIGGLAHAVAIGCLLQDDPWAKAQEFADMVANAMAVEMVAATAGHA